MCIFYFNYGHEKLSVCTCLRVIKDAIVPGRDFCFIKMGWLLGVGTRDS